MEQTAGIEELVLKVARLEEENGKLKLDLRAAGRELNRHSRTISSMTSNANVKMSMYRTLATENVKYKSFLLQMMKSSADFLILLDNKLNMAFCSDSFLQKIGVKFFDKVEGRSIYDLYGLFAEEGLLTLITGGFEKAVEERKPHILDVAADIDGSGKILRYRITHTPMLDGEELRGVFIDWNDNTDIINAMNEAERANRSKSNFLATMSHEIRTPLNAIIGIAQIQMNKENLPNDYIMALDKIHDSGNNLLGIINDILDMSKIDSGKMELNPVKYDVPSLINDTVQLNVVRIGSKLIEFKLDVDENMPSWLCGDELRLKQILNNLLSNAIKYTEKGEVRLAVSADVNSECRMQNAELTSKPGCETEGGRKDGVSIPNSAFRIPHFFLRFRIEDTGQGMRPDDIVQLFSEYSRFNIFNNRATEGTGLGMNITKKLVDMMDGTIEVESEYGRGSAFTVTVKQEAVECLPIGPETAKSLRGFTYMGDVKKERRRIIRSIMPYGSVLIVDDVETNLFVAEGLLSPYRLQIETVNSGFLAIDKVKSGKAYDIIFMDHMMPEMDGMETTQKLRAMGYASPIVALTANALVGNDEVFMRSGFDGFVSKPINVRHLDTVLNKFVRERHPEEAEKYKGKEAEHDDASGTAKAVAVSPRLLKIFCHDAKNAHTTMREAIAAGNIKLFTIKAHAMKSALTNIGEKELSLKAAALEEAGGKGDMDRIRAASGEFLDTLGALIKKLGASDEGGAGDVDVREDSAFLAEQLQVIKTACEDYDDTTAFAALDRLKEKTWKPETAAALEEIRDMLFLHSEFDEAAECAGVLLGQSL